MEQLRVDGGTVVFSLQTKAVQKGKAGTHQISMIKMAIVKFV